LELAGLIRNLDSYLHNRVPGSIRLDRTADHLEAEPDTLERLLDLYTDKKVVEPIWCVICRNCDVVLGNASNNVATYRCDLCDTDFGRPDLSVEKLYRIADVAKQEIPLTEKQEEKLMPALANELEMARMQPWAALDPRVILHETPTLGSQAADQILRDIERYGISLLRLTAQSAEDHVVLALAKLIGVPCPEQNRHQGIIKRIKPESDGLRNSGDTVADLGLHVDGTQHETLPAMLVFQYIAEAKIGANSIFVDAANVLINIDARRRHQILVNLARPDAATFSKRGMKLTAPIFSLNPSQGVVCRLRFDEVVQVHPDCKEDFEFLRQEFNRPEYQLSFRPIEGDIVIFDNGRVLHARDEVFGVRAREHNRMWLSHLLTRHQPSYLLGVRGLPLETLAAIKTNGRSV
jgi:alpha-ketoglutarate-dependent taurine dioxygenase